MSDEQRERIYRKDYRSSEWLIDSVDLRFDLDPSETIVHARMQIRRNPDVPPSGEPLVLDGEALELRSIRLDGATLDPTGYEADPQSLRIARPPNSFELQTAVAIRPEKNTQLMGLYTSNGAFCTQCEAEGFRRITYYLDRPDVMARYATRIEADKAEYPVLLSNGNRIAEGDLPNGRHFVEWKDPFRKPSYLFALVAGDLVCSSDTFTTASGRDVALEIWVEPQNADKCDHAMASLAAAMKWDEQRFGLEYDLDTYMIVAVDDFNMGAMENKGLNIFNSKFVLAKPSTATDDDYEGIESVVAHEYFHNWTGNRVTCRDWFQLTLKEGLTVFRDQEFSADMSSAAVQRIKDVTRLRNAQFAEDAGPLAHPIRPESYVEMNNFYTATVYEKGAEVVRLYQTLFGKDGFRKGLRHYLEKHDGSAATCDDFRAAMAEANGADLEQLDRWYSQAGTPRVRADGAWDESAGVYSLTLTQSLRRLPDSPPPLPLPIPIRVGLLDPDGVEVPESSRTLMLHEAEQTFTFEGVTRPPVPSLNRGFSAPIRLELERDPQSLALLLARDTDPFNRWEAGQALSKQILLRLLADLRAGRAPRLDSTLVEAFSEVLRDSTLDGSIKSLTLTLPSEELVSQELDVVDPAAVHEVRELAVRALAAALREQWQTTYEEHARGEDSIDRSQIDRRRMKNRALRYLVSLDEPDTTALAARQLASATVMTDYEAAFAALVDLVSPETDEAIASFHARWKDEPLVLDKWFRMQAMSTAPNAFARVVTLSQHPDFHLANPNRARALLHAFAAGNPTGFHRPEGDAYRFVADHVLQLDRINPQVAARIVSSFNQWRRYEPRRSALMKAELERIASTPSISKDVGEIVERALGG